MERLSLCGDRAAAPPLLLGGDCGGGGSGGGGRGSAASPVVGTLGWRRLQKPSGQLAAAVAAALGRLEDVDVLRHGVAFRVHARVRFAAGLALAPLPALAPPPPSSTSPVSSSPLRTSPLKGSPALFRPSSHPSPGDRSSPHPSPESVQPRRKSPLQRSPLKGSPLTRSPASGFKRSSSSSQLALPKPGGAVQVEGGEPASPNP